LIAHNKNKNNNKNTKNMSTGKVGLEIISKRLGLSDSEVDQFLKGNVVTKDLDATSDKELSLLVVVVVDADVHAEKVAELQSATMCSGPILIADDDDSKILNDMTLEPEALQKLEANPGGLYSMSKAEAQVMKDHKKTFPNVMVALRHMLAGRVRAYWEKGLVGIVPYDGGKGRDPRVDLEHANKCALKIAEDTYIHRQVLAVPSQVEDSDAGQDDTTNNNTMTVKHSLSWSVQKGRDLAMSTLDHRIRCRSENGMAFITRRFYSGYDYDASQIVTGVIPTSEAGKSVIFYTNHTYTPKVAGFGGSAKRAIGRKMMVGKLVATMQNIQAELKK
jgi:hypothetical protein